jgi:hypothetical protein
MILFLSVVSVRDGLCLERSEILRYEMTWNGNKAAHGDIAATRNDKNINVVAQAVADGLLKSLVELWSQVHATFTATTFKPQTYKFHLKSNLGNPEVVHLAFDHKKKLVQVNKQKGSERESHAEQFGGLCDPITAVYRLRYEKDLTKPVYLDIYDGKGKSRLFANPVGVQYVSIKTGVHSALCLDLKLVKLGGDKKEIANGKLWVSNDQHRIPLLLTSSPIFGQLRFELVQAQL